MSQPASPFLATGLGFGCGQPLLVPQQNCGQPKAADGFLSLAEPERFAIPWR